MKNETTKETLLKEIEVLLTYSSEQKLEINPEYLNYFDKDELNSIKAGLLEKKNKLTQEDIVWLEQFKKYE